MCTNSDQKILICTNFRANPNTPSCAAKGSNKLLAELTDACTKEKKWPVSIEPSPCMGMCHQGPNVRLAPNGKFFHAVSTNTLPTLMEEIEAFIAY